MKYQIHHEKNVLDQCLFDPRSEEVPKHSVCMTGDI